MGAGMDNFEMLLLLLAFCLSDDTTTERFNCAMCKNLMNQIREAAQKSEEAENYTAILEDKCAKIEATNHDLCASLRKSLPTIISLAISEPNVTKDCNSIGFCQAVVPRIPTTETTTSSDVTIVSPNCQFTVDFIGTIKNITDAGHSETEITSYAAQICSSSNQSLKGICSELNVNFISTIRNLLSRSQTPQTISVIIGKCTQEMANVASPEFIQATGGQTKESVLEPQCQICDTLIDYIEELLLSTDKQQGIEEKVYDFFIHHFGDGTISHLARKITNAVVPSVVNLIQDGVSHLKICQSLELCTDAIDTHVAVPLTASSDILDCDICVQIVNNVENLLMSQTVEYDIQRSIHTVCRKLPNGFDGYCDTIAHTYIPYIVEWFDYGLESAEICKRLGFCSRDHKPLIPMPLPAGYPNDLSCIQCKNLTKIAHQVYNANGDAAKISAALTPFCPPYGEPFQTICESMASTYSNLIYTYLKRGNYDSEMCENLGLCKTTSQMIRARFPHLNSTKLTIKPFLCAVCADVVGIAATIARNDEGGDQDIVEAAEKICDKLNYTSIENCRSLINEITNRVIEIMDENTPQERICMRMKLCDTVNGTIITPFVSNTSASETVNCLACKATMAEIAVHIESAKSIEQFTPLFARICRSLKGEAKSICDPLQANYSKEIYDLFNSQLTELQVCHSLGICPNEFEGSVPMQLPENYPTAESCAMCNEFTKKAMVTDSDISAMCSKYSGDIQFECGVLASTYHEYLISSYQQKVDVPTICDRLGLCSTKTHNLDLPVTGDDFIADDTSCSLCGTMAKIANSTAIDDATTQIAALCTKVSGNTAKVCAKMTKEYVSLMKDYLQRAETQDVCRYFGFCDSQLNVPMPIQIPNYKPEVSGCMMCSTAFKSVAKYLKNKETNKTIIRQNVFEYCATLNGSVAGYCNRLAERYVPILIQYAQDGFDSVQTCERVGFCPTTSGLVGSSAPTQQPGIELCEQFFNWARDTLSAYSGDAAMKLILNHCGKSDNTLKFCNILNAKNFESIVKIIFSYLEPAQICGWFDLADEPNAISKA